MTSKLALAQFSIKIGSPEANIAAGIDYIEKAARQGCRLILLPELWTSGYDLENRQDYIDLNHKVLVELQSLAERYNMSIGGSYLTYEHDSYHNTFILLQPGKWDPLRYHKIHLFRLLEEQKHLQPGGELVTASTPIGRVGLAVCYDVRFPEMFRIYGREHVDLLLVSAQWGAERTDHWRTLLRARAIENQFFVAAVNAVGPLREKTLAGYSAVIDPWGKPLCEADGEEEILLTAEIDLNALKAAAEKLPSREDSRHDLYAGWFATGK